MLCLGTTKIIRLDVLFKTTSKYEKKLNLTNHFCVVIFSEKF